MFKKAEEDRLLFGYTAVQAKNENNDVKLDRYLSLTADIKTNPLEWWKERQGQFPEYAQVAAEVLAIPATSTPSERVFSKAGLIVNKTRSSLKPKNVSTLLFIAHNITVFPECGEMLID